MGNKRFQHQELILTFLFFLCFTFLIGGKILFRNEVLFTGDNFDLLFPQKHFWLTEITQGRIPLWNPYILSGTPYLADINLGTLAPVNLFYLLISPIEKAASISFVFELFLLGFFTFLCARQYKVSHLGSVIAGLTFMGSGVILIYITNLAIFNTIVYLPVIVFFLEKALQKKSWNLVLFCGVLTAAQIVSGHAQITYYTGLLITILTLTREKRKLTEKIKILLTIFLVALGLSAIQILPFLELAKETPRVNQGYQWATEGSLKLFDLVKFIWPKFVWSFSGWTDFSSKINLGYIGVLPFLLLIISIVYGGRKWRLFRFLIPILVIAALGRNTPIYRLFYLLLPGLSSLKAPAQTISIYSFTASLLAGKGYDLIRERADRINLKKIPRIPVLFWIFIFFFILAVLLISKIQLFEILLTKIIFFQNNLPSFKLAVWFINFLFLIQFGILFLISLLFFSKGKNFYGTTIILITLMADLFLSAQAVLLTAPVSQVTAVNQQSNLMISSPDQRIYTIPPVQKPNQRIFSPLIEKSYAREKYALLLPNQNIYQKVYALDGYASMSIVSYINEFTDASKTVTGLGKLDISRIDFKNRGVSFILSQEEVSYFKKNNEFLLISAGEPVIYKVLNSRDRYFLESPGEIKFISEDSTQLTLQIVAGQPTRLILLDTFFPGWTAFIDNKEVLINTYENIYRNIDMPYGQHLVQFKYQPVSSYWGKIVSLFSIIICLLIFIFSRNKKFS